MRKIFLSLIALSLILNLKAQNKNDKAEVITCSEFHVTKTLREIEESQPAYKAIKDEDRKESEDRKNRKAYMKKSNVLMKMMDGAQGMLIE